MLSFRVEDEVAASATLWAERLGIDRSALLRDAVRQHLVQLASADDISRWNARPAAADEFAIDRLADWGPAEDWSDWA